LAAKLCGRKIDIKSHSQYFPDQTACEDGEYDDALREGDAEFAEPVEFAEDAEPAEFAEDVELAEDAEPVEFAEFAEDAEPVELAEFAGEAASDAEIRAEDAEAAVSSATAAE
ncbi:MAG: hypothetical protein LBD95_02015, partial [Clostridiales Family XIII bacterium]|nr:hypothetical protein [Clostridiales Family XIII bacterium]